MDTVKLYNDIDRDAKKYGYSPELINESRRQQGRFCEEVNRRRDAIWCIIALCHDLGYSLEKLTKLNEKVLAVLRFFDVADFKHLGYFLDVEHQYLVSQFLELMAMDVRIVPSDDYWELGELQKEVQREIGKLHKKLETKEVSKRDYDKKKEKLQEQYNKNLEQKVLVQCYRDDSTYWRLCRSLEKKDHGILSAFLIFKVLGIFADTSIRGPAGEWGLDDDEVSENVIRGDILYAIAQHQFDFAYLDQLSSLGDILVLADELEEFSRLGRQLQSRKYFDTAAYAAVEFEPVEGDKISLGELKTEKGEEEEKWTHGSRIDIHITYTSQHREQKEFLDFFRRKAERLCQLYSLKQEDDEREREAAPNRYCRIDSIHMNVEKTEQDGEKRRKAQKCCFTLSGDRSKTEGWLPRYEYEYEQDGKKKRKVYKKGKYRMECHEDKLVVCVKDHQGQDTTIGLRKWLGLENPERPA